MFAFNSCVKMLKVHRTSEMIDSQDVSKEELEVLKGDAVGNNLCSSKWIINTLMSLLKVISYKSYPDNYNICLTSEEMV